MSRLLDQQIKKLKLSFVTMGLNVSTALSDAVNAWQNSDAQLAQTVIDGDENINEQEVHLEGKSAQIIALQQPVAGDLRKIVAILKASSDLERLADHAIHIARKATREKEGPSDPELNDLLLKMAKNDQQMLDSMIQAYSDLDNESAVEISEKDHQTDEYLQQVNKIIIKRINDDPSFAIEAMDYMKLGNHFERIGDYVTNIAEWIVYTERGRITELGRNDY